MKIYKYIIGLFVVLGGLNSCTNLDIAPMNVVQDKDIFGSENGILSYMARIYGELPIEDFRYSPERGLNMFWIISPTPAVTGEAISRDQGGSQTENTIPFGSIYGLIRDVNYFMETLPNYEKSSNFTQAQVNTWLGEAYFIRGVAYYALAKRFGGVPLVDKVLNYPGQSIDQLKVPRASEDSTWMHISEDFDKAYSLLPETNQVGRANKYAAAGFKSRAMLYAACVAKYNTITLFDSNHNQLCGIASNRANDYFKQAYDAAKLLDGKYSLYMKDWKSGDKNSQYQNFVDLFFDASSSENIFVRQYGYPNSVHGYDCYNIPLQFMVGGYSSEVNPTLDFCEMFDGLPMKNGKIDVYDSNGKYQLYNNEMDFFANAEPRLRATVIFPNDQFKGIPVQIWRGIYTGDVSNGISRLIPEGTRSRYESTSAANYLVTSATPQTQQTVTLSDGSKMNAAGLSGTFYGTGTCAISGFSVRKYMNPNMPAAQVLENHSDQTWIELRYAEVLLNRAEAAYELYLSGYGNSYRDDAYNCISQIQNRAGANITPDASSLTLDIIRKERRKELSFENKTWWDLKRWRILDKEQNSTTYRILMPFYASKANKWFFDDRYDELNRIYTWDSKWYYEQIPSNDITTNSIIQNPGY